MCCTILYILENRPLGRKKNQSTRSSGSSDSSGSAPVRNVGGCSFSWLPQCAASYMIRNYSTPHWWIRWWIPPVKTGTHRWGLRFLEGPRCWQGSPRHRSCLTSTVTQRNWCRLRWTAGERATIIRLEEALFKSTDAPCFIYLNNRHIIYFVWISMIYDGRMMAVKRFFPLRAIGSLRVFDATRPLSDDDVESQRLRSI